jgi:hypothetical protein
VEREFVIVGFTGTRKGMNAFQADLVESILNTLKPEEVHSGDCVGADEQFHALALKTNPNIRTVGHPPDSSKNRAHCRYWLEKATQPPLNRNRAIVDAVRSRNPSERHN